MFLCLLLISLVSNEMVFLSWSSAGHVYEYEVVTEKSKTLQWMQPRNGHISEIFKSKCLSELRFDRM